MGRRLDGDGWVNVDPSTWRSHSRRMNERSTGDLPMVLVKVLQSLDASGHNKPDFYDNFRPEGFTVE